MEGQRRSLRVGALAVLLAVGLRLWDTGAVSGIWEWLRKPETAAVILYLETGKVFRPPPDPPEGLEEPDPTAPGTTAPTTELPSERPSFSGEDAALVYVRDTSGNTADVAALLETPLAWDLAGEAPTVLLYHTHATESYTQTRQEQYPESSEFRTLDTDFNMVSIGDRVEALLTEGGIGVIHAETLHDYPSYNGGYDQSRKTVKAALEEAPGIRLVLDLHRDAAVDANGKQFVTSAVVNGRESAQIMFLLGTGYPGWQENMALAVKLTALLEKMYPGITRGILTRTYDYNQDLSPGALLVEVGSAGDTREKALVAAEALSEAIILLAQGSG